MDRQLMKLSKSPNRTELCKYVEELPLDQIHELVTQKLSRPPEDADPVLVLRALFLGAPPDTGSLAHQVRMTVLHAFMDWVKDDGEGINGHNSAKVKLLTHVVNVLSPELEMLETCHLDVVGTMVVECIEQGIAIQSRVFDLMAKVYNLLCALDAVDMASTLLQRLCHCEWNPQSSVGLASCLNDLEMPTAHMDIAVKRLVKQLKQLEIDEIPPYIYQLLILVRKGKRQEALTSICEYFDWFYAEHPESTSPKGQSMQGTVMLHMSFAIKQDTELGMELIKYLRTDKKLLMNTFKMACLLSAARIHRLEDMIYDLLKNSIITIYKDGEKLAVHRWVAEFSSFDAASVRATMMDIVDKSESGWDQVIQSTIHLAMLLIDTAANAGTRSSDAPVFAAKTKQKYLNDVIQLGVDVIARMFKLHDVARTEILEQIASRVVSRSPSAMFFLQLMEKVVLECRESIGKNISQVKYTLDFMSYLPHPVAKQLLRAIQPIAGQDPPFRDDLMLVLRKSVFVRELDARMISVYGHFSMLHSQLDSNQSSSRMSGSLGIVFEILSSLRRCFNQQFEIRAATYEGLGILALRYDMVSGDIFRTLYTQFLLYCKDDDAPVPLDLQACLESGHRAVVLEPLQLLTSNLFKVVRHLQNHGDQHTVVLSTFAECEQKIKKLTDKLFDLDLEDYGLDKTTNFDAKTPDGQRNLRVSDVLIGVLEAALEHEFLIHGDTLTSCQIILTLFKKRKELMALRDGAAKERGFSRTVHPPIVYSLEFTASAVQAIFLQGDVQSPVRALRSDLDFIQYLVTATGASINKPVDDQHKAMHTRDIEHRCVLAKVYLHILIEETSDSTLINHQPKKGNSILCAVATNLHQILTTTEQAWPDEFSTVLMQMLTVSPQPQPTNLTTNCLMMTLLRDFKEIVDKYLNAQPPLYKEATVVLQTISWLTSKLDSSEEQYEDDASTVTRWMVRIMEDRPIQEVAVAREVLSLLMTQCTRQDQMDVLKNITNDIHMIYGDIDVQQFDSQAAITTTYTLINEKTIQPMAAQILTLVEDAIVDMIWCIGRLKMCDEEAKRPAFELATIERMDAYVEMVNELTRAGFMGALAEQMIRTLTKMYRTLMTLMKYKLTKPKDIPPEFIHIVAKIGNSLTDNMYRYLTSYTSQRKEEYERASSNARKKAKGKGKRNQVDEREKKKIMRESKAIPTLIFSVEQFEKYLISLARKSKVDLMQYMKRSTSRDFRIQLDKFVVDNDSDDDLDKSMSKRRRMMDRDDGDTSAGPSSRSRGPRDDTYDAMPSNDEDPLASDESGDNEDENDNRSRLIDVHRKRSRVG